MKTNRSIPGAVIIPELPYPDVREAVAWLCDRFHFTERLRIGDHRAQLTFRQGALVVTAAGDQPIAPHSVMVRVEGIQGFYAQLEQKGVRILDALTAYPYGEMQFVVEDLAGHRWIFSQTFADVDPREWGGEFFDSP